MCIYIQIINLSYSPVLFYIIAIKTSSRYMLFFMPDMLNAFLNGYFLNICWMDIFYAFKSWRLNRLQLGWRRHYQTQHGPVLYITQWCFAYHFIIISTPTEESFLNHVKINQIWSAMTLLLCIWQQTQFYLVSNQSEKCN